MKKFGPLAEAMSAPRTGLLEVDGMRWESVTDLKIVRAAASRLVHAEVKGRSVLLSRSAVFDYCRTAHIGVGRDGHASLKGLKLI